MIILKHNERTARIFKLLDYPQSDQTRGWKLVSIATHAVCGIGQVLGIKYSHRLLLLFPASHLVTPCLVSSGQSKYHRRRINHTRKLSTGPRYIRGQRRIV